MKNNPAEAITIFLGGAKSTAHIAGIKTPKVYNWSYPRHKRGSGGVIPAHRQVILLSYARAHDIDLQPGDFFDASRLQAIIAANPEKYKNRRRKRGDHIAGGGKKVGGDK